jgi:two-component system, LuxR family, response regulator DctR
MTPANPAPMVYVVDDESAVRDAIAFLLASRKLNVRTYADGRALLDELPALSAPSELSGCFLLDVRMEPLSGPAIHDALIERGYRNPVLFLSAHGDVPLAVAALKKGAFDFLEKPTSDNVLCERIEQALAVDAASRQHNAGVAERRARLASLTERERAVMHLVAAGKQNKVIADELHVSIRTVEVHRARGFAKLAVRSAPEVATLLAATD